MYYISVEVRIMRVSLGCKAVDPGQPLGPRGCDQSYCVASSSIQRLGRHDWGLYWVYVQPTKLTKYFYTRSEGYKTIQ